MCTPLCVATWRRNQLGRREAAHLETLHRFAGWFSGSDEMAKKKLTKQEKRKIEADKAEALRIQTERERYVDWHWHLRWKCKSNGFRLARIEADKEERSRELKESIERQNLERQENKLRRVHLAESCTLFSGKHRTASRKWVNCIETLTIRRNSKRARRRDQGNQGTARGELMRSGVPDRRQ